MIKENLLSLSKNGSGTGTNNFKEIELSGDVINNGLMEIPSNASIKDVIYKFGGGINGNRKLKAVQLGGASGIYLNRDYLNLRLDNDSLKEIGFVGRLEHIEVFDDSECMVNMACSSIGAVIEGLCGKCIPCREGTKRILEILEKIISGAGVKEDVDILSELTCTISDTSLCRLGKMSVNPVESSLRFFRNEYIAHVAQKRCPADFCAMGGGNGVCESAHIKGNGFLYREHIA